MALFRTKLLLTSSPYLGLPSSCLPTSLQTPHHLLCALLSPCPSVTLSFYYIFIMLYFTYLCNKIKKFKLTFITLMTHIYHIFTMYSTIRRLNQQYTLYYFIFYLQYDTFQSYSTIGRSIKNAIK
jgi:hypothetical protein